MSEHCDVYPVVWDGDEQSYGEPRREDEAPLSARVWGLPYFNGYTVTTAMHGDGECEAHRPKPLRRRPIGGVS